MHNLLLFLPLIYLVGFFGLLALMDRRKKRLWDLPYRDDMERAPGESVRLKIDTIWETIITELMFLHLLVVISAIFLSVNLKALYIYIGVLVILGFMSLIFRKLMKLLRELRNHRIGFEGERITAQYLQPLFCQGHFVYHDIPMGDYNVDHVVVGPKGVFAVETKTRRKRRSAGPDRAKVLYDGNTLQYPGKQPERFGLDAAVAFPAEAEAWAKEEAEARETDKALREILDKLGV